MSARLGSTQRRALATTNSRWVPPGAIVVYSYIAVCCPFPEERDEGAKLRRPVSRCRSPRLLSLGDG